MNKGIIYATLSGLLYGMIGYFGHELMAAGLSLNNMLFWRFLIAALLLYIVLLVSKPASAFYLFTNTSKAHLRNVLILGGIFYSSCTALYFIAAKTIGTGLAMVLFYTYPILVVLLSWYLEQARISRLTIFSIICILSGCILISLKESISFDLKGIMTALLSAVSYAVFVFGSKKYTKNLEPITSSFLICFGNAIAFGCMSWSEGNLLPESSDMYIWLQLGMFAFISTVLPILFLTLGLQYISASKASVISVLEPVVTVAIGAAILGEHLTLLQIVGAALILSSAVIITFD